MAASPLRKLRLPLVVAALVGGALAVAYALSADPAAFLDTPGDRWVLAAFLAALGVVGVQIVRFFVLDVAFYRAQGHRAPALLHVLVALALYFVLGLLIASNVFGQPLTGALATSAVASVVLGLALQETLGNFFSGIALQAEQPFRLGDVVRTGELEGRVAALNWRATTIETIDDSRIVIPNALIAREAVEVFARSRANRRRLVVPAPYGVPPQRIVAIIQNALVGLPGVSERQPPQARVASFDDSSVGYEVLYWVEDYLRVGALDAVVRERVWYAFARNDVSIPFPHEIQIPYRPPTASDAEDPAGERARWLGEVEIFAPLAPEERLRLAERAQTLVYGPGETLLRTGGEGGSMLVVLRGRVEIRVTEPDGQLLRVAEVGAGEVIGEMSLLTGEPRSADARALDEVEVIEVRRADMKDVLATNEALAEALADEASLRLSQRADALAQIHEEPEGPASRASLLHKIRTFFDLG